jgi:hypothetical protein
MTPRARLSIAAVALVLTIVPALIASADDAAAPAGRESASRSGRLRECGTPDPSPAELAPVRAALRARVQRFGVTRLGATIPIALHVITSGGVGDVGDRQIDDQLRALNQGYAGTGYRFVLSSVDRTENKNWFTMAPGTGSEKQAKQALAIDPAHHLNVYTCAPGKNLLGWAYFPFSAPEDNTIHGVVIHYGSLPGGYLAPYDLGGTLIHESGHYLGLFHTFQGGCVPPGDEVDDTPFEASPAFGCPAGRNTCAQPGDDPIHNYMDYTDDACYTEFTPGQLDRINAILPLYRPSLFGGSALAANARRPASPEAAMPLAREGVELRNAFPNPFEDATTLRFSLQAPAHVLLAIYSLAGQRVRTLIDASLPAGDHSAWVQGNGLPPGTYFASLSVGDVKLSRSLVHVR